MAGATERVELSVCAFVEGDTPPRGPQFAAEPARSAHTPTRSDADCQKQAADDGEVRAGSALRLAVAALHCIRSCADRVSRAPGPRGTQGISPIPVRAACRTCGSPLRPDVHWSGSGASRSTGRGTAMKVLQVIDKSFVGGGQ